ncbi:cryptochrome/photolyase family protein [Neptunitalea lumnitzerae]|uniref:Deoxyribodipyrimidine photo-lyase n=1 Tax=Neptunitalea lumnitzerae TaxID=2965509 RepID=A0ABQ5MIZ5_9FLAO|nr:deoxyribodipyrimidine photo-lyase [Neptunitalea sp. Y10]GLB49297.1 deoxyribodipyrimidine photo-lyase [Neptunitalea sp. Y10]
MKEQPQAIFWFRRDLRLHDNIGFYNALKSGYKVLPIFIFDKEILQSLPEDDARVTFIYDTLQEMRVELQNHHDSSIALYYDTPENVFKELIDSYNIKEVYTNNDYEPYAIKRDQQIGKFLEKKEITFHSFKDQVIFEKDEVVKDDGDPYLVYTPFMKKWKETFKETNVISHHSENQLDALYKNSLLPNLNLSDIGFKKSAIKVLPYNTSKGLINNYSDTRNFPATEGTSNLSPHLRFGTVSVRQMVKKAKEASDQTFLSELIWREFFMQILWHFPKTLTDSFKPAYDNIKWRNNKEEFELWKQGKTGYPLVDAGMRELNETGYMHNRVRMVVGSFLCKHLLIDWRWGEAYFAEKLLDYEMSSNVGNWQWVAGTGVDAAPYFRIFNPTTQLKKFDKDLKYTKKWVKDFDSLEYAQPIVEHSFARNRCLNAYKEALNNN